MTAPSTYGLSTEARNLHWLLANLVEEVPGLLSVAVVSSDGLLLLSSDPARDPARSSERRPGAARDDGPKGSAADLAAIVSGLGSLTLGASRLMNGGKVKQTVVTMRDGNLCVMSISDGSLLGVHATPETDMGIVAYHMAFFVGRAGHVLTPELRSELRQSMEHESQARAARDRPRLAQRHGPAPEGWMAGKPTGPGR